MKTIHLLCSLVVVIALAVSLGGIYPPAEQAHAETAASKAPQAPEKSKTDIVSSEAPKPLKQAKTKQGVEKKTETPIRKLDEQEKLMQQAGIPEADWPYLRGSINKESGWCATKWEGEIGYCPEYHGVPATGGYGLCQSTPAHKMASMGEGWETDPIKQLKWCHQYGLQYGSWKQAIEFRNCLGRCYSTRTHNYQQKVTTWF